MSCVGALDGTLFQIAKPGDDAVQNVVYNGKDRVHALKYLGITGCDGMTWCLFGPVEGRHHDSYLVETGRIRENLRHVFRSAAAGGGGAAFQSFCVFADKAFGQSAELTVPFRQYELQNNQARHRFNRVHKAVRLIVEWGFGKPKLLFPMHQRIATQRIFQSRIGIYHRVAFLLTNAHTCCYGSETSGYMNCTPIDLEVYFV